MKHKLLLLIVGAIGLIIGSAASGWVVFAHWEMRYSELYATTLQSEAQWLVLCGDGRHGRDWHQRLITLEKQALAVATEFPENPNTEPALRSVREVYEHAGRPIPDSLAGFLDGLADGVIAGSCGDQRNGE